ncbi:MAG TPA: type II secretion system F family protein [Azospirillaceae bacterium]|nr:type II secretion system F family protein [Azospirillaceae bacterium]
MSPLDLLPGSPAQAATLVALIGALVVMGLVWRGLVDYDPLPARLKALDERRRSLRSALAAQSRRRERRAVADTSLLGTLSRRFERARGTGDAALQLQLARAGYRSREALAKFRMARTVLPVGMAGYVALFAYGFDAWHLGAFKPLAVIAATLAGLLLPRVFLVNQAQKRQAAIRKALPDGFDLLVICAEAGLSLDAALDRVARETGQSAPELSDEVALTALELSFLPDRSKALSGLAERVPLPGIRALVNTFAQTERYGTPLAQALRVLSAELRDERMMKAEEKAARLPAVMTVPMVVFILPPLFIVLIGPAILRTIDSLRGMN